MKKVLSLIAIAAMTTLVACGPSAEETAAAEKLKQDSITSAQAAAAEAEASKAQAIADSTAAATAAEAAAEAAAAAKKPAGKPAKKAEPKEKEVKVGGGRR